MRILTCLLLGLLAAAPVEAATTGDFAVTLRVQETGTADLGVPAMVHLFDLQKSLTSGTSSNQADKVWSDERSVTSGVPDDVDLMGALTGAIGGTLNLTKPVGLCIWNESTTAGQYLTVGADGTAPVYSGLFGASDDAVIVQPNGVLCWWSPISNATATATTADILQVAAASGTVTYRILVWARSS